LPYLVMELLEGESLRDRIDRLGRLTWEATVELADKICLALHAAHQAGVVHRRLTPARVMIVAANQVKLVGFDCAWSDRDEVTGLRSPMEVAHYLSPEAFRGRKSASFPTCDMFSLGVLLFECLTGAAPWPSESPTELIRARRAGPAPRASTKSLDCPVWLDVLVARLLETDRRRRLTSADATHRAIVDAERKASSGFGAAKHALSGREGVLTIRGDRSELKRLRKRSEPTTADDSPFYERAWFLAICLVLLLAVGAWTLWPASEDALFAKAQPLMRSDKPVDWRRAQDQYVSELLDRFPDTKYATEIEQFQQRLAVHRMRERIKNIERFGRPPANDV
ncbi:MAG: serine/threonine-protein kinase, partial [Planctomycetota bacterium]